MTDYLRGFDMNCTWHDLQGDCSREAKHPQTGGNGKEWANLCDEHNKELEAAITGMDAKRLLRCWVCASGGAKKMAESMVRA